MTNELILVRHATCERMDEVLLGRTVDAPLDAAGMRQAVDLSRSLQSSRDALVVASPRRRAQQTAAAIARTVDAEMTTSLAIDELDFGRWSGCTFEQLDDDPEWRRWNEQRGVAVTPAGESIAQVRTRTLRQLVQLQRAFPARAIVIVTHAEVIRSVVLHWLDASIDSYRRLSISPASATRVSLGDWGVRIDSINERALA